ncbi:MAG: phosphatidylserine decarboxylase family protein [Deltaproteobacteria bacterium]|nr:phosphatidylserine decarboxylase family protein [Deltaproteobacteria bacterium]MBI3388631.1 phosphatidylserine decarboxylase family protein [Deltaproteobacteria bacterium]
MPAHWAGLPIAREGYPLIAGAAGIALLLWLLGGAIGAIVGAGLFGIVLNFFRDPERISPADERLIVAPADGRVITVAPVREDRFLHADTIKVSIFMSPLNVHVNRNPVSGAVVSTHYNHGKYFRAFAEKASLDNEQNAIVVEDKHGRRVCFVQIAGFLARRIVCYLRPGMNVERGRRCGIIKFGSRVDIYLPPEVAVQVRVGDHTTAGETVIGSWQ